MRFGTCRRRDRGSRRSDFRARNPGLRFRSRRTLRSTCDVVIFLLLGQRQLSIRDKLGKGKGGLVIKENQALNCLCSLGWWKMKASSFSSVFYGGRVGRLGCQFDLQCVNFILETLWRCLTLLVAFKIEVNSYFSFYFYLFLGPLRYSWASILAKSTARAFDSPLLLPLPDWFFPEPDQFSFEAELMVPKLRLLVSFLVCCLVRCFEVYLLPLSSSLMKYTSFFRLTFASLVSNRSNSTNSCLFPFFSE